MRRARVRGLMVAALLPLAGCAPALEPDAAAPDGARWRRARADLARLRARYAPAQPRTQQVKLTMRHEPTGRQLQARGAVAVGEDGLRMILLGPGGTTALDLWICGEDFRYRVPALDLERRGVMRRQEPVATSGEGGLPVRFLRWWFLERLRGRLLSYRGEGNDRRFVLADEGDVFFVQGDASGEAGLTVMRGRERLSLQQGDCGRARYRHDEVGLTIEVVCEAEEPQPPPARAFADPDDPGRSCREIVGGGA